jgi:hypothetical protein
LVTDPQSAFHFRNSNITIMFGGRLALGISSLPGERHQRSAPLLFCPNVSLPLLLLVYPQCLKHVLCAR